MESIKQRQVASVVKRSVSSILQQEGTYIYGATPLVTVTKVKMTPDFGEARVYLSVFNTEDKQTVLLQLEDNAPRIKQLFASDVRKQLRRVPELTFYMDDTLDEMYRIDQLFNDIEQGYNPDEIK